MSIENDRSEEYYGALLELLGMQNIINVYAVVTGANPASHSFHRSLGFAAIGTFRNTGYKGGQWYDVVHYDKHLAPCAAVPAAFVPVGQLDAGAVNAVLRKWSEA